MSFYLKLATKNLFRHTRRTLLTTAAVVAGIGVLVLGQGFIHGLSENIVVSAIEGTVSHLTARPADYPEEVLQHPIDDLLTITPEARRFLDANAVAWTGRAYYSPTLVAGSESMRVKAIGYDPETDPSVFPRKLWTIEGNPDPGDDELLVSRGVAASLGISPGDFVTLQVRTHTGALNALDARVAGLVKTTHTTIDNIAILVPQPLSATLINSPLPSHLSVLTKSRDKSLALAGDFQKALGDTAEVITWDSETKELLRLQQIRQKALNFIVFILLALAGFGMANTILMAAYERVREIGTLRAMGMTEGNVLRLFLFEGAMMGFGGSALGCLWGGALTWYWAHNPIDLSSASEAMGSGIQFSALIYTEFSTPMMITAIFFGTVVAAIASVYPARVASRMIPADAVRA